MNLRDRPLLLPALALWGWQMDLPFIALAIGAALELPRWLPVRLEIATRDFERLWNFTAVLFLGVVFYLLLADQGLGGADSLFGTAKPPEEGREGLQRVSTTALTFLRWLPLILLPFVLAHAWSRATTLPWSVFSLYEQARARREPLVPPPAWATQPMHPGLAFQGVVLFAAIALPDPGPWFLPVWLVVLLAALWPWRSPHATWRGLVPLLLVLGLGAWAAHASHGLSRRAWDLIEQRLQASLAPQAGEGRQGTALGVVGRLQLSNAILLRGEHPPGRPPGLLVEGIFDRPTGTTWELATKALTAASVTTAPLDPGLVTVTRPTVQGRTALAIPTEGAVVSAPWPLAAEATSLGALRVAEAPPLAIYQVRPARSLGPPPGPEDLRLDRLPETDRAALQQVLQDLPPGPDLPQRVAAWLDQHCRYDLVQVPLPPGTTPLAHFLSTRRAGHCEFFATATVLLLRAGGVPARYAVGFAPEADGDGTWVARGRNAHAWCLAWSDGRWTTLDTTPGDWQAQVPGVAWWEAPREAWSWVVWRFDRWRSEGGNWRLVVFVLGLAVLAWIAWRQVRGSRWLAARIRTTPRPIPGADSELLPLIARLERRAPRPPGTPLRGWLAAQGLTGPAWTEALDLHERLRFDPAGLDPAQRARLAHLAQALLPAVTEAGVQQPGSSSVPGR